MTECWTKESYQGVQYITSSGQIRTPSGLKVMDGYGPSGKQIGCLWNYDIIPNYAAFQKKYDAANRIVWVRIPSEVVRLQCGSGNYPPINGQVVEYTCPYCGTKFPTEGELNIHIATCPSKPEDKYICPYCKKVFSTQTELDSHITQCPSRYPVKPPVQLTWLKPLLYTVMGLGGVAILMLLINRWRKSEASRY